MRRQSTYDRDEIERALAQRAARWRAAGAQHDAAAARRKQTDREILVDQIQRESLRMTLQAFPALAERLDGDAALRRVAQAWAAALLDEAGS